MATNLIVNGDFETDVSNWSVSTNCTIAQSAAQANTGTHSLAMTAVAAGDMQIAASSIACVAGQTFNATAWMFAATSGRTISLQIAWYAGVNFLSQPQGQIFDTVGSWNSIIFTTTAAPATATFLHFQIYVTAPAAGEVHYLDTVSLYLEPPPPVVIVPAFRY